MTQDDWSLSSPLFGSTRQLEVIALVIREKKHPKLYAVKCSICCLDSELFGTGVFLTQKAGLLKGLIPCGCGKNVLWNKQQYEVLCKRKAKEIGNIFNGFTGTWNGCHTAMSQTCPLHGEWSTGTISNLLRNKSGCYSCWVDKVTADNTKPDNIMIASFLASGAFHRDTKFWRSERTNSRGDKEHWYTACAECDTVGETKSGDLQIGRKSCACSPHRQEEAYINLLLDNKSQVVALKFGIANNSYERAKVQNRSSVYNVVQHSIYSFGDVKTCRQAERDCKKELETRVVLKRDMPDGWTETTWVYNLEKIIEIYERNGGVLNEKPRSR